MEPYTRNGSIIGKTMDFGATDFYQSSSYVEPSSSPTFTQSATSDSAALDPYTGNSGLFVANLIFPSSPNDGLIWETGGTGQGAWLGIRDSGTTMRLRGGDGAASKTASTTDTAVLDITDFPKDGLTHELMWDFNDATGTVRIFIDGVLKGEESATGGSFDSGQYAGVDNMAYLQNSGSTVTTGESSTASNFTEDGTGLRYYNGLLAQLGDGNKKNSGIWDLQTVLENVGFVAPPGQQAYTTAGSYSWTAPEGVTSVCVLCVGGGGGGEADSGNNNGGAGGGLGYKNNITVVPGNSYTVVVGAGGARGNPGSNGGDSYFIDTSTVAGFGGDGGGQGEPNSGGTYAGDGGGDGGRGGNGSSSDAGGGGGAGGYSGNGGQGADLNSSGSNGSGGGGGGGGAGGSVDSAGGGGGVGILGEGSSGAGGSYTGGNAGGGGGGSGGADGTDGDSPQGDGGAYGGGGGGADNGNGEHGNGADGAVRIIWGEGRAFPSTNTGDV